MCRALTLPALPDNPSRLPTVRLVNACTEIFKQRDEIVGSLTVDAAIEALRRTSAIEKYVRTRAHKDEARRAARVLETAVGAALGPAINGVNQYSEASLVGDASKVDIKDRHRFRLMNEYRGDWWAGLETKALSRTEVLRIIDKVQLLEEALFGFAA